MESVTCALCGGGETKRLLGGRDRLHRIDDTVFTLVQCNKCGLVYLNPRPSTEEIGKYYPEEYGPYRQNVTPIKYGPISRLLSRVRVRPISNPTTGGTAKDDSVARYLDFGCGSGAHLEQMRERHPHWEFYGLDAVDTACAETKKKGFEVFCGDALTIETPRDFFDEVYMSHVVEHLHHPQETLNKIYQMLKHGGRLRIMTPNFNTPSARLFRSYWYALDTPRHLYLFTPKTLAGMLEKAGFHVSAVEFDRGPKVFLKSLWYLLHRKDLRTNPFVWRVFKYIALMIGERSIMLVEARKV